MLRCTTSSVPASGVVGERDEWVVVGRDRRRRRRCHTPAGNEASRIQDAKDGSNQPSGVMAASDRDRVTSLPLDLLHSCLHFIDTPSLLRFGRCSRAALAAVDQPLAWDDQHDDGDDDDEDEEGDDVDVDAECDLQDDGSSVAASTSVIELAAAGAPGAAAAPLPSTRTASLAPLTLGRRRKRRGPRVVLLHSHHSQHLTHPSLVRSHAAVHFVSHAATGDNMAITAIHFGLMSHLIHQSAAKSFPPFDASLDLTALSQVQHLERLFVSRTTEMAESLDDDQLQVLLQLPHIRRALRGVYFITEGCADSRRPRLERREDDHDEPVHSRLRLPADSEYLSLPTMQLIGTLPHVHTLCIDDAGTAYGVLPMLHKYMPQLTTLAFEESRSSPQLPSSDVMSIGLCPRLHTLMITGSERWHSSGDDAGHLFLPFFSQPLLRRNLRRLHLIGYFRFGDVLLPVLRGLRALRTVACDLMNDEILSALVELTREDRPHDQLQLRSHPLHQSTTRSSGGLVEDCTGAVDGVDDVAYFTRSRVRELIITATMIGMYGVQDITFTRLYSGLPTTSPLMVYFRPKGDAKFTPVESVCRFQSSQQMADVEMVHRELGVVDPAHLARLVVCPQQPQMYGPAHLHHSLPCPLLEFDWLRYDRAHILPSVLPAAVAAMLNHA